MRDLTFTVLPGRAVKQCGISGFVWDSSEETGSYEPTAWSQPDDGIYVIMLPKETYGIDDTCRLRAMLPWGSELLAVTSAVRSKLGLKIDAERIRRL